MKLLKLFVLVAAIAAAAGGLAWYWHRGTIYPSTDDAYVEANILTLSPQVMARVTRVAATEGARVVAGDVLVTLDDSALKAAVDAARAQLDLAIQAAGANATNVSAAEAALTAWLAFQDAFLLSALAAFAMLPLALVLKKPSPGAGATSPAVAH